MTFRFLPPAEAELLKAISYYSAIRTELGVQFGKATSEAVRAAAVRPERGAPRSKSTRRWFVKGFPYGVICAVEKEAIIIVAIAHERRMPAYWADRID